MNFSTCITNIILLIYLATSVLLLYVTYLLSEKTGENPLKEEINAYDINLILNTSSTKFSLTSFLEIQEIKEKKNLRVLMDDQKCESYKNKILELITKDAKEEGVRTNLNKVFGIDLVLLNSTSNIFFYVACVVVGFFIYFYLVLVLSVTCCSGCINLLLGCIPCFACFLEIFSFVYLIFIIILVYHQYWGAINDFIEFMDCPSVNKDYLLEKYGDINDIKKYIQTSLYVFVINFIVCWIASVCTKKEKENIKEYYITITEIKTDIHDDSIN